MRGKVLNIYVNGLKLRITPAYAGKNRRNSRSRTSLRDHPRLCGEKCHTLSRLFYTRGSPPPMRGKVFMSGGVYRENQDHPRLCGEKKTKRIRLKRCPGSPPPMRGKDDSR